MILCLKYDVVTFLDVGRWINTMVHVYRVVRIEGHDKPSDLLLIRGSYSRT